jgi:hypothetical protein
MWPSGQAREVGEARELRSRYAVSEFAAGEVAGMLMRAMLKSPGAQSGASRGE